jgi:hypothetical protein
MIEMGGEGGGRGGSDLNIVLKGQDIEERVEDRDNECDS